MRVRRSRGWRAAQSEALRSSRAEERTGRIEIEAGGIPALHSLSPQSPRRRRIRKLAEGGRGPAAATDLDVRLVKQVRSGGFRHEPERAAAGPESTGVTVKWLARARICNQWPTRPLRRLGANALVQALQKFARWPLRPCALPHALAAQAQHKRAPRPLISVCRAPCACGVSVRFWVRRSRWVGFDARNARSVSFVCANWIPSRFPSYPVLGWGRGASAAAHNLTELVGKARPPVEARWRGPTPAAVGGGGVRAGRSVLLNGQEARSARPTSRGEDSRGARACWGGTGSSES